MNKIFRSAPAAAIVMQAFVVSAAHATDTRASGVGVCTVYETAGTVEFEYSNCKIVSHVTDQWTKFIAEGFEAEFTGDAMEDTAITQNGESYVRTDDESKWCYAAEQSDYSICFTPSESS